MVNIIVTGSDVMKFYLFLVVLLLQGCQQKSAPLVTKNSSKKVVNHKIICQQSTTPPLKNIQKLKEMLVTNGTIDASLSEEEIQRQVNAYIRKKNAAFKSCQK
jgi:ribosomal protein L17